MRPVLRNQKNQVKRCHGNVNRGIRVHFDEARSPAAHGRNVPGLEMRLQEVMDAGIVEGC